MDPTAILDAKFEALKGQFDNFIQASKPKAASLEDVMASLNTGLAALNTKVDKIKVTPEMVTTGTEKEANLEDAGRAVKGITGFEIWNIPIGQAVIGGFVAVLGTELIDGFMARYSPMVRGITELALAGGLVAFGSRFMGRTLTGAAALLIAFDGLRKIFPVDTFAQGIASKISGATPTAGLAQVSQYSQRRAVGAGGSTRNYYSGLGGS